MENNLLNYWETVGADKLPHDNCNYILPNVLVGSVPNTPELLISLLQNGVRCFINLMSDFNYGMYLESYITYFWIPIPNEGIPLNSKDDLKFQEALEYVIKCYPNEKVYIHCYGGNGRAGTFAAILYGLINKVKANQAIEAVIEARKTRRNKKYLVVPTPESNLQVDYVIKYLTLEENTIKPDRSDMLTWKKQLGLIPP